MLPLQIRCYHPNALQPPFVFYILAKGDNAGKPAFTPWANCFMAVCSNEQAKEYYFWLCYGLHSAGRFKPYHRGSAIQFLNISDVQAVVKEIAPSILPHWQQYQQVITALNKLEQKKVTMAQHIVSTQKLQGQLINAFFFEKQKGSS